MDQEKLRILKMVEEKKISVEEAAKLFDALEGAAPKQEPRRPRSERGPGRQLKLKVSDLDTGRVRVNLTIPVGIAHIITSLIPQQELARLEQQGFNVTTILDAIHNDSTGKIFDVEDEEHRTKVEISIE